MGAKRNLLFITTDQQRFDSFPCNGAGFVQAPNLERLASEGVSFDGCYVSAPICVPCRATMMTGMMPSAHGAMDNNTWIDPGSYTWPRAAAGAGYTTAAIGKMHFAPWDAMEGFDERIICEDKRHSYLPDDHAKAMKARGIDRPLPTEYPGYFESHGAPDFPFDADLHPDAFVGEQAASWIRSKGDSPFALWVSFPGPHDPYDPPPAYSALYDSVTIPEPIPMPDDLANAPSVAKQKRSRTAIDNAMFQLDYTAASHDQIMAWRRHYFGNITLIDEGIGKILEALESVGILDDTVIVFTSDHGDALGDHGMVFKAFFYESMVHVPLVIRDGGNTGRRSALVSTPDIVAYFHDILSIDTPESIQGSSLSTLMEDPGASIRDHVVSEMPTRRMVFDGRYKYVFSQDGQDELYDRQCDPDELSNIVCQPDSAALTANYRSCC